MLKIVGGIVAKITPLKEGIAWYELRTFYAWALVGLGVLFSYTAGEAITLIPLFVWLSALGIARTLPWPHAVLPAPDRLPGSSWELATPGQQRAWLFLRRANVFLIVVGRVSLFVSCIWGVYLIFQRWFLGGYR